MIKVAFGKPHFKINEIKEINHSLKNSWVGTGPKTKIFEDNFKKFKKSKYAIAVSSCTSALHLSLLALGIKKGDEVITTSMTFCSTINAILHAGAKPVLLDINKNTINLNENEIENKITKKTKCLVVVHFAGLPCKMDVIMKIAKKNNLKVIEDCAHAVEANLNNIPVGTFGDTGCFSFYANKNLSTGEGGMVITNKKIIEKKVRLLSLHGLSKNAWKRFTNSKFATYDIIETGYKYNMTDLQASLGIHQLSYIKQNLKLRNSIWETYSNNLQEQPIILPAKKFDKNIRHSFHLYTIKIKKRFKFNRDILANELQKRGIVTGIHYKSIADFKYYKKLLNLNVKKYKNSINYGKETLSLPIYPSLKKRDQMYVIDCIKNILKKYNV